MKKIDLKKDPHRKREINRYENPIPSREFIIKHLEELGRPATYSHFLRVFDLKKDIEKDALKRRLNAMLRDGQLLNNRRESYALANQMSLIRGRIYTYKEGYGFLIPDDGTDRIFLPPRQLDKVFHGDKALVSITSSDKRGRREGTIVEVLEKCTTKMVGRFIEEDGICFVAPSNKNIIHNILIPDKNKSGACSGDIVVADIVSYPNVRRHPVGQISKVLGKQMEKGMETEISIISHCLPNEWPEQISQELNKIPQTVTAEDKLGRKSLQELPFVTIDGEDAKDFDDAVYCEKNDNGGWRLYVAIADVSHYVKSDTTLDFEALNRGNSVYFPNRVIPMLPHELSNNICSLLPHVERLVIVCEMNICADGTIKDYVFYESVICSKARLTYNQVFKLLEGTSKSPYVLIPHLKDLHSLYLMLKKKRYERGALEFNTPETKIIFGKNNKIKNIILFERNYAHEIIEECMLAANVCASEFLLKGEIPSLFRGHLGPDAEKLDNLRKFLGSLGLKLPDKKTPKPIDYAKLLHKIHGRVDEHLIQMVVLRSLQQAIYTAENIGHFGLAYEAYSHFTSPIRRYPDLLNHRAIRYLLNKKDKALYFYDKIAMQSLGEHCSMTERRADEATRDSIDWLKCEYMLDKKGKTFDGVISGVMNFGIFVELKDVYVEGLIHITSLKNDYYVFEPAGHFLVGKRFGACYKLGDKIRVIVTRVDLDERQIDFGLVDY